MCSFPLLTVFSNSTIAVHTGVIHNKENLNFKVERSINFLSAVQNETDCL